MSNNTPKNPCAKMRTPQNPYEIWKSFDGTWTWRVLKKYQSPEKEAQNPYARWLCHVTSPYVPEGEMGDTYVSEIKRCARRADGHEYSRDPEYDLESNGVE